MFRSTGSPGGSGAPRAVAQAFLFANEPGFPKLGGAKYFPRRWLRAFSHQMTGVAPKSNDSSFPFACGAGLSFPHTTRGFPSAAA